jgi:hypothetical protein
VIPERIIFVSRGITVLTYADDIVLIGKNEIEIRHLFVEMENFARNLGLQINQRKIKYMIVEWKKNSKLIQQEN